MSMGFYTSKSGHKINLKLERIYDFSQGNFMDALTVCIAAMYGRYDDILRWPAEGTILIELLNQKEDRDHEVVTSIFTLEKAKEQQKKEEHDENEGKEEQDDKEDHEWTDVDTLYGIETRIINGFTFLRVTVYNLESETKPLVVA